MGFGLHFYLPIAFLMASLLLDRLLPRCDGAVRRRDRTRHPEHRTFAVGILEFLLLLPALLVCHGP
jgi:hypothetical protein